MLKINGARYKMKPNSFTFHQNYKDNLLSKKIRNLGTIILAGLSTIMIYKELAYSSKNFPEKFENFKGIKNIEKYRVIENDFTKGDIINIEMIEGKKYIYDTISINPEKIVIYGIWNYEIKPEGQFTPKDENNSDINGNTSENQGKNYWKSKRHGAILLEKKLE